MTHKHTFFDTHALTHTLSYPNTHTHTHTHTQAGFDDLAGSGWESVAVDGTTLKGSLAGWMRGEPARTEPCFWDAVAYPFQCNPTCPPLPDWFNGALRKGS